LPRLIGAIAAWLVAVGLIAVIAAQGGFDDSPWPLLWLLPGCGVAAALLAVEDARFVAAAGTILAAACLAVLTLMALFMGEMDEAEGQVILLIGALPLIAALAGLRAPYRVAVGLFIGAMIVDLALVILLYPRTTSAAEYGVLAAAIEVAQRRAAGLLAMVEARRTYAIEREAILATLAAQLPGLGPVLGRRGPVLAHAGAAVALLSATAGLFLLVLVAVLA
jgi:hypothetical protein